MRAYICRELPRDFVGETVVVTCHRDTSLAGATRFVVNRLIFPLC